MQSRKFRLAEGSVALFEGIFFLHPNLMKKGGPHDPCPDKAPKLRLKTIRLAAQPKAPVTIGLLIGIGESWQDPIDALKAINNLHLEYGHIQEVIIQNFRAKPGTAMSGHPEPYFREMLLTLAMARMILNPSISLQAPPKLQEEYVGYLDAGINDWGGISPLARDYINPDRE